MQRYTKDREIMVWIKTRPDENWDDIDPHIIKLSALESLLQTTSQFYDMRWEYIPDDDVTHNREVTHVR